MNAEQKKEGDSREFRSPHVRKKEKVYMKVHQGYSQQQDSPDAEMLPLVGRERSFMRESRNPQARDINRRRSQLISSTRVKPGMELYRPPSLRIDELPANFHSDYRVSPDGINLPNMPVEGQGGKDTRQDRNGYTPSLNVHAKEFQMRQKFQDSHMPNGPQAKQSTVVSQSFKSSSNANAASGQCKKYSSVNIGSLQQSKSSGNILQHMKSNTIPTSSSSPHVHFQVGDDNSPTSNKSPRIFKSHTSLQLNTKQNQVSESQSTKVSSPVQPTSSLKRSKSLGAADMRVSMHAGETPDLGSFASEVQNTVRKAVEDPNRLSARTLMELVRHIFNRVVESTRYAEPAAKLCITIIENEKKETFLESLLNTCQDWFQERDRLLRNPSHTHLPHSRGFVPASPRWIAFITFLNEMYCQLKRQQLQLMTKYDGVPPGLVLLTLLCECCHVGLKPPSINSLSETECLFFVLVSIGRDLEQEMPARMYQLVSCVRDTFLSSTVLPPIRKTLLQLIELQAARWQLSASAVMYYYPGSK